MNRLILLSGKKRSGKDTSASLIKQLYPRAKLMAFASPLKNIIATTFNIPMAQLEEYKDQDFALLHGVPKEDQEDTSFQMQSYREVLQRFGSEAMKEIFGVDVWSELAVKQIKGYFEFTDTVVITDWRFPEEYKYIYNAFVEDQESQGHIFDRLTIDLQTVRIDRDGTDLFDGHVSEVQLDDFKFDHRITNNGSIDELKEKLKEIL